MIHAYYGKKVMIIWDRLSTHLSARSFFERENPDEECLTAKALRRF